MLPCLNMVGSGMRRLVKEGGKRRLGSTSILKEVASSGHGMSARRSSSTSAQTISSAKGEVAFKSVLIHLVLSVMLIENLPPHIIN